MNFREVVRKTYPAALAYAVGAWVYLTVTKPIVPIKKVH